MTARRHDQHPDGEPANAGKRTSIAAKAAAIDAAQARPLTWKSVVKRALAVAVAGAGIYLVRVTQNGKSAVGRAVVAP